MCDLSRKTLFSKFKAGILGDILIFIYAVLVPVKYRQWI
jgi:hypothetical protein